MQTAGEAGYLLYRYLMPPTLNFRPPTLARRWPEEEGWVLASEVGVVRMHLVVLLLSRHFRRRKASNL